MALTCVLDLCRKFRSAKVQFVWEYLHNCTDPHISCKQKRTKSMPIVNILTTINYQITKQISANLPIKVP